MTDHNLVLEIAPAQISGRSRTASSAGDRLDATRVLDIAISLFALVFLLPIILLVAFAVKLQDGGPIIFAHERIGRNGRRFPCLKFRSMVVDSNERLARLLATDPQARADWEKDHKLRNDPRITALGLFMRKSSLDELPQFWNVLRGDMSIVGPRPIVSAEVSRYGRRFQSYCSVRPGITGLWQVSGRNDTSYRRRVAMDYFYSQRHSLMLYLWIVVATVPAVLLRRGSY